MHLFWPAASLLVSRLGSWSTARFSRVIDHPFNHTPAASYRKSRVFYCHAQAVARHDNLQSVGKQMSHELMRAARSGRKRAPQPGEEQHQDDGKAICGGPKAAIVIARMGGNSPVSRMFQISSPAVSGWKKLGIPWECVIVMRQRAPDILAAPTPEEAQEARHWPRVLISRRGHTRMLEDEKFTNALQ